MLYRFCGERPRDSPTDTARGAGCEARLDVPGGRGPRTIDGGIAGHDESIYQADTQSGLLGAMVAWSDLDGIWAAEFQLPIGKVYHAPTVVTGAGQQIISVARTAFDYLDRNHLAILNMAADAGSGWAEAASFGLGTWAQRELGLSRAINQNSVAHSLGGYANLLTPGGWRALVTNPRAAAASALAAGRALSAMAGNASRAMVSMASRGTEGLKALALRAVDALPVPGLGVGGVGGGTIGALRAAGKAAARGIPKSLNISSKQFGKKLGQKARELGLDPASARDRFGLQDRIQRIFSNADEVRTSLWRGLGEGGSEGSVLMFRRGQDVVVTTPAGDFVTLLEGGATTVVP